MSSPTLAATAAAVLLAAVGSAVPRHDGTRAGRALAHLPDERSAHIGPTELGHFAEAQPEERSGKRRAEHRASRRAFAHFPTMKG